MSQHTNGPTSASLQDNGPSETYTTSTTGTTGSTGTGSTSMGSTGFTGSKSEAAKEATRETAETARGEAKHVAQTAKDELGNVTATATDQMRRLMDQSRSELTEQARSQQQRLSGSLRTLTDELDAMAGQGDQQGVAHDVVRQVSQQARALGDWLDGNEPGAVLDEVKRFARRRPGTFLAVAAGLGFLSGRMTRGLTAAAQDEADPPSSERNEPVMDGPLATTGTTATYPTAPTGPTNPTGSAAPSGTAGHPGVPASEEPSRESWASEDWAGRGDAR
ncbi:hypothetical protein [Intrasporangium sp.]|uniref:hypothetical protein n=1 Tax=Intrasporangium sp. TaxID=1925024 RepID=UPI00293B7D57|nr:hypothetical protein [Intrasporangium sp.]MDV3220379.1 hypothetical protein [Intrasporangium sp.]